MDLRSPKSFGLRNCRCLRFTAYWFINSDGLYKPFIWTAREALTVSDYKSNSLRIGASTNENQPLYTESSLYPTKYNGTAQTAFWPKPIGVIRTTIVLRTWQFLTVLDGPYSDHLLIWNWTTRSFSKKSCFKLYQRKHLRNRLWNHDRE